MINYSCSIMKLLQPNSIESGLHFLLLFLLTRTQKGDKVCFQGHKKMSRKENK